MWNETRLIGFLLILVCWFPVTQVRHSVSLPPLTSLKLYGPSLSLSMFPKYHSFSLSRSMPTPASITLVCNTQGNFHKQFIRTFFQDCVSRITFGLFVKFPDFSQIKASISGNPNFSWQGEVPITNSQTFPIFWGLSESGPYLSTPTTPWTWTLPVHPYYSLKVDPTCPPLLFPESGPYLSTPTTPRKWTLPVWGWRLDLYVNEPASADQPVSGCHWRPLCPSRYACEEWACWGRGSGGHARGGRYTVTIATTNMSIRHIRLDFHGVKILSF